jgi:hypothetical protein
MAASDRSDTPTRCRGTKREHTQYPIRSRAGQGVIVSVRRYALAPIAPVFPPLIGMAMAESLETARPDPRLLES